MSDTVTINPLSLCSVFIEMLFDETVLGTGTAFFVRKNESLFLVTNWHNLSGRNPDTKKPIHEAAALPNKIRIHGYRVKKPGVEPIEMLLDLKDKEDGYLWFEHSEYGSKVDVAALPVIVDGDTEGIFDIDQAIKEVDPLEKEEIEVGDSLFVLGYPFGLSGGENLPIWKSATIASEPEVNCDNLPLFYIDTATRQGMSGSPVIQFKKRGISIQTKDALVQRHANFIGVYSGRIVPKDLIEVQLGKVWKKSCIDLVISGRLYTDI